MLMAYLPFLFYYLVRLGYWLCLSFLSLSREVIYMIISLSYIYCVGSLVYKIRVYTPITNGNINIYLSSALLQYSHKY
jgi:hypothetical protein